MEQSHPSPDDMRITRIDLQNNRPVGASEAPAQAREVILAHAEQLRQHALDILPDHDGGAEVAQIDAFYEEEGLNPRPAKILSPEELVFYREELAKAGYIDDRLEKLGEPDEHGTIYRALYLPQLGLAVAVRLPQHEGDAGQAQFRALLAHEKAHSTTEFEDIKYVQTEQGNYDYHNPRVGQTLYRTGQGVFLEEAFAEYMAARFTRQTLGPNGVWPSSRPIETISVGGFDPVPPAYIWPEGEGAVLATGAFAAYGLELINRVDPNLHAALIEGRKSAEGLRQVAQIIDGVRPGLYPELRNLSESPDEFMRGLRAIQEAITEI